MQRRKNAVNERLQQWGLYTQSFAERLDNWFCNFDESDHKRLALRVFHALKYYTPDDLCEETQAVVSYRRAPSGRYR